MSARPSPLTRDILLFIASQAVGFWGIFERPTSITYPLYKDVVRALTKASYDKSLISNGIKKLIYRNYLKFYQQGENVIIAITEKGKQRVAKYRIEEVGIPTPKVWDSKWRVVIFDIPEQRKLHRETFRSALRRLGFQILQKSVAVHPFPCREEIFVTAAVYSVLPYIRILEVESVDPDDDLFDAFGLHKRKRG